MKSSQEEPDSFDEWVTWREKRLNNLAGADTKEPAESSLREYLRNFCAASGAILGGVVALIPNFAFAGVFVSASLCLLLVAAWLSDDDEEDEDGECAICLACGCPEDDDD